MQHPHYAAKLPTRTAFRKTANRTRAETGGHSPNAAVVIAATAAAVAATTVVAGFALAVVVATLPAHLVALLAGVFVITFAPYTLPLLTLRAVARVAQAARVTA